MNGRDAAADAAAERGPAIPGDDGGSGADPTPPAAPAPPARLRPFRFLGDYPKNRNNGWHSNVQGVTHDGGAWFVSQRSRIWRFPVGHDLNRSVDGGEPGVSFVDLDELPLARYDHLGDLDHHRGRLYVALEDSDGRATPAVAVLRARDFGFLGAWLLPAQGPDRKAPWCAVNPVDGRLYTSSFWVDERHGHVKVYRRAPARGANALAFLGELVLRGPGGAPVAIDRVQGGVVSANGNLYLVSDTEGGGILGFATATGRQLLHTPIAYDRGTGEELEGITLWDLDGGRAPGVRGQVHVLMIDEDATSDDDLYVKHFRVRAQDRPRL